VSKLQGRGWNRFYVGTILFNFFPSSQKLFNIRKNLVSKAIGPKISHEIYTYSLSDSSAIVNAKRAIKNKVNCKINHGKFPPKLILTLYSRGCRSDNFVEIELTAVQRSLHLSHPVACRVRDTRGLLTGHPESGERAHPWILEGNWRDHDRYPGAVCTAVAPASAPAVRRTDMQFTTKALRQS